MTLKFLKGFGLGALISIIITLAFCLYNFISGNEINIPMFFEAGSRQGDAPELNASIDPVGFMILSILCGIISIANRPWGKK